jgi:hypothetical protein
MKFALVAAIAVSSVSAHKEHHFWGKIKHAMDKVETFHKEHPHPLREFVKDHAIPSIEKHIQKVEDKIQE